MSAEDLQEAAGGLLEDSETDASPEPTDATQYVKKALLSTEPHDPPTIDDQYLANKGMTEPVAYAWRGFRKTLNGLGAGIGLGDNIFKSALFDYGRSLYSLATGENQEPPGQEPAGNGQGPSEPDSFDMSEPEEPQP